MFIGIGLSITRQPGPVTGGAPPASSFLLLESGDVILLESGDKLLLE
jgi:hypothetical protein